MSMLGRSHQECMAMLGEQKRAPRLHSRLRSHLPGGPRSLDTWRGPGVPLQTFWRIDSCASRGFQLQLPDGE